MQRRTNASAAVKNAGEIGCSQMLKVHSFGEKRSMESNNSYINYVTQLLNSGYIVVGLAL
jgi:hypothetical protein